MDNRSKQFCTSTRRLSGNRFKVAKRLRYFWFELSIHFIAWWWSFPNTGGYFYLIAKFERHRWQSAQHIQCTHLVSLSNHMRLTNYIYLKGCAHCFPRPTKTICIPISVLPYNVSQITLRLDWFEIVLPNFCLDDPFYVKHEILYHQRFRMFQLLASFRASHWWTGEIEVSQELTLGIHRLWYFGRKIFGRLFEQIDFCLRDKTVLVTICFH